MLLQYNPLERAAMWHHSGVIYGINSVGMSRYEITAICVTDKTVFKVVLSKMKRNVHPALWKAQHQLGEHHQLLRAHAPDLSSFPSLAVMQGNFPLFEEQTHLFMPRELNHAMLVFGEVVLPTSWLINPQIYLLLFTYYPTAVQCSCFVSKLLTWIVHDHLHFQQFTLHFSCSFKIKICNKY